MKNRYIFNFFILIILVFSGCQKKIERPIVLSANLWIGYAPLYYAYEKGWLRKNNIKFVTTISLSQSLKYYKKGSIDIFAGTNYEYKEAKTTVKDLIAVKLLDISKSGDMVYSNKNINELKSADKIDIYEELDSINSILIQKFIKKYKLTDKKLNFLNTEPDNFLKLKMQKNPLLIVTYKPYDRNLKRRGFEVLATAKDLNLTIFDALFVSQKFAKNHQLKIGKLKNIFDNALRDLQKNPQEFYTVVNPYFNYKSYINFRDALKSISWQSDKDLESLLAEDNIK